MEDESKYNRDVAKTDAKGRTNYLFFLYFASSFAPSRLRGFLILLPEKPTRRNAALHNYHQKMRNEPTCQIGIGYKTVFSTQKRRFQIQ